MDRIKGAVTCNICGRTIPLIYEEHYIASDNSVSGITTIISHEAPQIYDAIDCPHCGCQAILQKRKYALEDAELNDLEEDEKDE